MAKSETLTRYELLAFNSSERMNVLLDNDFLNPGQQVTLDEIPDKKWIVMHRHETFRRASINRGWDNNI